MKKTNEELMTNIIDLAEHNNDIAEFGKKVADLLMDSDQINTAVYETLTSQ